MSALTPEIQGLLGCLCGLLIVIECVLVAHYLEQKREDAEANAWLDRYFAQVRADRSRRDSAGRFLPAYRRNGA